MRNKIPFDIYTILIVAIVPVFLAAAWGLTWNHQRVVEQESCDNARAFLEDAAGLTSAYTNAGLVDRSNIWVSQIESITVPGAAQELRDTILDSMNYAMTTDPELETSGTGEIYDALVPLQDSIDTARDSLVQECPDTASLIPEAFPMFFKSGENE